MSAFFTLLSFLSVKTKQNNLNKQVCPKMVRKLDRYQKMWFSLYDNYRSIYRTVYLGRTCLIITGPKKFCFNNSYKTNVRPTLEIEYDQVRNESSLWMLPICLVTDIYRFS